MVKNKSGDLDIKTKTAMCCYSPVYAVYYLGWVKTKK